MISRYQLNKADMQQQMVLDYDPTKFVYKHNSLIVYGAFLSAKAT